MATKRYGDWLKTLRRAKGLTQAELEVAAELGHSHLSKIENGHIATPEKDTRDRIHAVLGTSDDDLVTIGILRRSVIDGVGGNSRTIYFNADGTSEHEYRLVHEGPEHDPDIIDRFRRRLEMVDLSRVDRVATLDGILDAWERADEAERGRKS